jgi:hypothetical protein
VTFAHLAKLASSLPTDASALESSISALESAISDLESKIKALDNSSVPWEYSVWAFTFLVVVGVVMELWVIRHEWREDMETWALAHFGVLRSPGRPLITKLRVEVGSVLLIAIGVMGELGVGIKITSIASQLRGKSALLRSKNAELRIASDQLIALINSETEEAKKEAKAADLARVKIEAAVAWRHLTEKQKADIGTSLGDFSNQEGASFWYEAGDTEAGMFAVDIAEALKVAHIVVQPPAGIVSMRESGRFGDPIKPFDTGVTVSSAKDERSRSLADAIVRELTSRGFDATRGEDNPPKDERRPIVWIKVNPRPEGPQGEYKLQAERDAKAKKKQTQSNQATH